MDSRPPEPLSPEPSRSSPLHPRLIPGLSEALVRATVGKVGHNMAAVNGTYYGEGAADPLIFSPDPILPHGRTVALRLNYGARSPLEEPVGGRPKAPALIDRVQVDGMAVDQTLTQRALEHNAAKIIDFLRKGGKMEDLPQTPFMPDYEQLKRLVIPL